MSPTTKRTHERRRPDLLVRPPARGRYGTDAWATTQVSDPVAQIEAFADLRQRGLISAQEFEREKAKILSS